MWTIDICYKQLNKHNEEICGDRVEITPVNGNKIIVLSDGLGSGIKANILASLTTKIISTMLKGGCSIEDVTESINKTLPVCKVRKIAYSTFTIINISVDGIVKSVEYDNPPIMWFSDSKLKKIPSTKKIYGENMEISEASFKLKENDYLVIISDGVTHAGIGGMWNLGWGWERVAQYIQDSIPFFECVSDLCDHIVELCNKLYMNKPGDDSSVVAIQLRKKRTATVLIGPPYDKAFDEEVAKTLLESDGKKIVCGGTTANIISKFSGKDLEVLLETGTQNVPPIGKMKGIDLVTEGVLTLAETVKLLQKGTLLRDLKAASNGAELLLKELLLADEIKILLGQAINPAHQNPNTPLHLGLKLHLVEELCSLLRNIGKDVTLYKY